jgi:hypothetical protein
MDTHEISGERKGEPLGPKKGVTDPISIGGTGSALVVFLILVLALLLALGLRWLIF